MKIYLINQINTNKYKIGVTKNNVSLRVKQLQTGSSESLTTITEFETNYGFKLESILHRHYDCKKTIGEWFELSEQDITTFLKTCETYENNFKIIEEQNTYYQDKVSKQRKS